MSNFLSNIKVTPNTEIIDVLFELGLDRSLLVNEKLKKAIETLARSTIVSQNDNLPSNFPTEEHRNTLKKLIRDDGSFEIKTSEKSYILKRLYPKSQDPSPCSIMSCWTNLGLEHPDYFQTIDEKHTIIYSPDGIEMSYSLIKSLSHDFRTAIESLYIERGDNLTTQYVHILTPSLNENGVVLLDKKDPENLIHPGKLPKTLPNYIFIDDTLYYRILSDLYNNTKFRLHYHPEISDSSRKFIGKLIQRDNDLTL